VARPFVEGWTVPAPEGRNAVRDRTRWVLCVAGCVPGEASESARAGPRDPTRFAKTPWQVWVGTLTSEHGGLSSQRPRVQIPSTLRKPVLPRAGRALAPDTDGGGSNDENVGQMADHTSYVAAVRRDGERAPSRWCSWRPSLRPDLALLGPPVVHATSVTAVPEMGGQTGASPQSNTIPTGHNSSQGSRMSRDRSRRSSRHPGIRHDVRAETLRDQRWRWWRKFRGDKRSWRTGRW
jgi:hypothetical protein